MYRFIKLPRLYVLLFAHSSKLSLCFSFISYTIVLESSPHLLPAVFIGAVGPNELCFTSSPACLQIEDNSCLLSLSKFDRAKEDRDQRVSLIHGTHQSNFTTASLLMFSIPNFLFLLDLVNIASIFLH
jgi:hypothetical protein